MTMFGWVGFPSKFKAPLLIPVSLAPEFDPLRKVAPPGMDEIDFDKRIALWESLIAASGDEDDDEAVNDN
ncbi:MAG: hypothetical protein AAF692_07285 [Pseudomonadota bacterium]